MSPFDPTPSSAATDQVWSDELAELVYCTSIAGWLAQLGPWLGFDADVFPPKSPLRFAEFENKEKGIKIMLHYPFWDRASFCDPQNWTIHQLDYEADHASLPFGLDTMRETPRSARAKLCDDTASFPDRWTVTHYLPDARVVAVEFRQIGSVSRRSISRVSAARSVTKADAAERPGDRPRSAAGSA